MKIFVGNLSFQTNSEDLIRAFSTYGAVDSATVLMDRDTGQSRGFGFVEMAQTRDAQRAIQSLNGTKLDGRAINVN